jgi:hypothetical protein
VWFQVRSVHNDLRRLTISVVVCQGLVIGACLGGTAFIITIIISIIYIKRRQRLRLQGAGQTTIESGKPAGDTQAKEVPGTLTPFTLPLPFNILPRVQTPLTESSSTTFPPTRLKAQAHTRDPPNQSQLAKGIGLRTEPEGRDTLVEMLHHFQERLILLERERDRDRRVRVEDSFETRSDGTSDAPPTYKA